VKTQQSSLEGASKGISLCLVCLQKLQQSVRDSGWLLFGEKVPTIINSASGNFGRELLDQANHIRTDGAGTT
jgi:hypothetical protein